jgi:hypothetical protein
VLVPTSVCWVFDLPESTHRGPPGSNGVIPAEPAFGKKRTAPGRSIR